MPNTPMNERNIMYFPMQSVQIGTDEQGDPIYDNAADAEILQKLRQREIKDGVYPDDSTYLQVMSNNDMTVTVKAGYAHIQGVQVWMKEDVTLTVEDADLNVDRIDRVVLRLSMVDREVTLAIKKGDTSLTRIAGQVWELGLADLHVAKNNAVITQAEIDELRQSPTACGVVSGLMQVDTSTIFNQYLTWWEQQQDTTGYLTVPGEYPALDTVTKTVLGAINEVNSKKLQYVRYLTSSDDLNSFSEEGIFISAAAAATARNFPTNNDGILLNIFNGGYPYQIYLTTYPELYFRHKMPDNDWSNWSRTLSQNDVINNLTSGGITNLPLSANQGFALNSRLTSLEGSAVKTSGAQSIAGAKTFTSSPVFNGDPTIKKDLGKLYFHTPNAINGSMIFYNATDSVNADFIFGSDAAFKFRNYGNSAYVAINASAFTVGSSYRWKDNINPFTDEDARKLLNIELKTFTYKPEFSDDGGKIHMGVIAEQIAELFPDAVTFDEDGLPAGVDYSKLVVPCIGMIQQQQHKIDAMTALLVSKGLVTQAEIDNL